GLIELLCVVLVFFRLTRPVGALLTFAVMANVVTLDRQFEVPALPPAVALLTAAAVLIISYAGLYWRWLSVDCGAAARSTAYGRVLRVVGSVVKGGVALFVLAFGLFILPAGRRLVTPGPLYGSWQVQSVQGAAPDRPNVARISPGALLYFEQDP